MVDVKTAVVSVVALFSIFLQPGISAQPTIDSSSEDDSCPQLEEELESQVVENMRLRSVLESERQARKDERLWLRKRELKSVTTTSVGSFDHAQSPYGITKVENKIYVLDNRRPNGIKVYEDLSGFRLMTDIPLSTTKWPSDIVYNNETKCVYIVDSYENCIWVMTTTVEHRLTNWLSSMTKIYTISLSNEGHLLVLRRNQSFSQDSLEIYSLNATLIRSLQLPQDVKDPQHVVQTSTGNFIILHRLNTSSGPWVISQLINDGQLIHRFIPRNQSEQLNDPQHLSLDPDNNRLFVADFNNHRVILFDSNILTWSQILMSQEMNGIRFPWRLFYDASKKHLIVAQYNANVTVYEIS